MIEFIYQRKQPGELPYRRPVFLNVSEKVNPYYFEQFDVQSQKPFFIFYSEGRVVAAAHLSWQETEGNEGAFARFFRKFQNVPDRTLNKVYCFDPLLNYSVRYEEEAA